MSQVNNYPDTSGRVIENEFDKNPSELNNLIIGINLIKFGIKWE